MKVLLVVGLLLGIGFPVDDATGQTAACRKALGAYKSAVVAFLHATVALGPANLVQRVRANEPTFQSLWTRSKADHAHGLCVHCYVSHHQPCNRRSSFSLAP
jgi:hypothetical protein